MAPRESGGRCVPVTIVEGMRLLNCVVYEALEQWTRLRDIISQMGTVVARLHQLRKDNTEDYERAVRRADANGLGSVRRVFILWNSF